MSYIDWAKVPCQKALNTYQKILIERTLYGREYAWRKYKSKHGMLTELFGENHYQDKSTGTVRELATLWISGAEQYCPPTSSNPAYDGIRNGRFIEAKPVTHITSAGAGHINDHTLKRHERFIEDDLIMQSSSFIDDKLAFIVEFDYKDIKEHMESEINRKSSRVVAHFRFTHWYNLDVNLVYFNKALVESNKSNISGGKFKNPTKPRLYQWLMDHEDKSIPIEEEFREKIVSGFFDFCE